MSRELLKQPLFYKWSTVWVDTLKESKNNTALANTNRLVRFYEGADGVKTGSTSEAGYCLSATAKRGDMRLIAIVLGAPNSKIRFSEASKLLDYGFANYKTKLIQKKDQIIQKDIKISGGKTNLINGLASRDISLLLKIDDKDDFNRTILIDDKLRAPIERGDKIGSLRIEIDGKTVDTIDIISDRNVSKAGLIDYIKKIFNSLIRK
jgi:D-alanyl-D-alanine carboxypeptidase (penicillin-binding protein 5/6)